MSANTKQSKLSAKDEECTFTWKIFTSWDYGIANVETAHNKVSNAISNEIEIFLTIISIYVVTQYEL